MSGSGRTLPHSSSPRPMSLPKVVHQRWLRSGIDGRIRTCVTGSAKSDSRFATQCGALKRNGANPAWNPGVRGRGRCGRFSSVRGQPRRYARCRWRLLRVPRSPCRPRGTRSGIACHPPKADTCVAMLGWLFWEACPPERGHSTQIATMSRELRQLASHPATAPALAAPVEPGRGDDGLPSRRNSRHGSTGSGRSFASTFLTLKSP
jgi:hypothetical protein